MAWFRLLIRGENFQLSVDGQSKLMGFYTTRCVQADSSKTAEAAALELLRQDNLLSNLPLSQANPKPMIYFEEIEQLSSIGPSETQKGLAWFPMGA